MGYLRTVYEKEEVMKKRLTSLFLVLCVAFSLAVPVGAATEADQNGVTRITREIPVSGSDTKKCTIAGKEVTFRISYTSTVFVNDTNNDISYFAPTKITISGLPSGMRLKSSPNMSDTEYNIDGKGTAEQRGAAIIVASGSEWPVTFVSHASINRNGTVAFGVY